MFRQSWKWGMIGLVVVIALIVATPASAGWGHRCCGYGGYWGYYSPWYYSGWYAPCGWGCSSGCYGCYSSCYSGCYGSCYGGCSWGGCCDSGWATAGSCCGGGAIAAPANQPTPAPAAPTPAKKPILSPEPAPSPGLPGPAPESTMPKTSGATSATSGVLTVWVPYDAKVTVNGLPTHSTGTKRQFISYGLKPGYSYKYVIRASVVREGQTEEELPQTVTLTAGQIKSVAFGFNMMSPQVAAR